MKTIFQGYLCVIWGLCNFSARLFEEDHILWDWTPFRNTRLLLQNRNLDGFDVDAHFLLSVFKPRHSQLIIVS